MLLMSVERGRRCRTASEWKAKVLPAVTLVVRMNCGVKLVTTGTAQQGGHEVPRKSRGECVGYTHVE